MIRCWVASCNVGYYYSVAVLPTRDDKGLGDRTYLLELRWQSRLSTTIRIRLISFIHVRAIARRNVNRTLHQGYTRLVTLQLRHVSADWGANLELSIRCSLPGQVESQPSTTYLRQGPSSLAARVSVPGCSQCGPNIHLLSSGLGSRHGIRNDGRETPRPCENWGLGSPSRHISVGLCRC